MPNWLLPTFLGLVIFVLAIELARRKTPLELASQTKSQEERNLISQRFYLEILRRELANVIMNQGLEVFERAFNSMCDFEDEIGSCDEVRRIAEQTILLKKYPHLEDFDIIGTRHFVRYHDGKNLMNDTEDLVERYKDISKFMIVNRMFALQIKGQKLYDDREKEVFRKCMRDEKNHRLRLGIEEGMRRFRAHQYSIGELGIPSEVFEDEKYEVTYLSAIPGRPFSPENEYGVYCKELNEFGIYSTFSSDGDKIYRSYHRTDSSFRETGDSLS